MGAESQRSPNPNPQTRYPRRWLRARWYGAGRGAFGGRDPFVGEAQTPYSLQYYQYGYSNPVGNRDPRGKMVQETLVTKTFSTRPAPVPVIILDDSCPTSHDEDTITLSFTDLGIVLGYGAEMNDLAVSFPINYEHVYDFLSFSRDEFRVAGSIAANQLGLPRDPDFVGGIGGANLNWISENVALYFGGFTGLSNYQPSTSWSAANYQGESTCFGASMQTPFDVLSIDITPFQSVDQKLSGTMIGLSAGASVWPYPIAFKGGRTNAQQVPGRLHYYRSAQGTFPSWPDGQQILADFSKDWRSGTLLPLRAAAVVRDNVQAWEALAQWQRTHQGPIFEEKPPFPGPFIHRVPRRPTSPTPSGPSGHTIR